MLFPDYPFEPRAFEARPGITMSYLDEGPRDGEVVVMVHGNPSWSYYWRHLVLGLRGPASGTPGASAGYRCIVPDHVGMGLSDKPDDGGGVRAWAGETALFITPGYRFKVADLLLTNFHLPRSTLLMLVAALAGLDRIKTAYAHAVAERYRFFSYGDACLIEAPPR